MNWLAFDIGGANLKVADGRGFAAHHAFALWKDPRKLAAELRTLIAEAPPSDHLAVTMTGELADCFPSKSAGVKFILDAVHQAADGRHTRVYLNDGRLVAPPVALRTPLLAAAANWHALASFGGRFAPQGEALLIDIGSTTTDLVPLRDGKIAARGQTDTERLIASELVYTGVERTPLCGLLTWAPYRDQQCPVMQEFFATTLDVYLLTGDIEENPASTQTADRRPATKAAARQRIGRMIGSPEEQFHHRDALQIAQLAARVQLERLLAAARRVIESQGAVPQTVITSGAGEFLALQLTAQLAPRATLVSLEQQIGPQVSRAAPAHALAVLASEIRAN